MPHSPFPRHTRTRASGNPSRSFSRSIWCEPRIVPPNVFYCIAPSPGLGSGGCKERLMTSTMPVLICTVLGFFFIRWPIRSLRVLHHVTSTDSTNGPRLRPGSDMHARTTLLYWILYMTCCAINMHQWASGTWRPWRRAWKVSHAVRAYYYRYSILQLQGIGLLSPRRLASDSCQIVASIFSCC